jgi:hypothetical protein
VVPHSSREFANPGAVDVAGVALKPSVDGDRADATINASPGESGITHRSFLGIAEGEHRERRERCCKTKP